MSLVEHWEMKHPLRAVWNTRYRPGDLLIVQGAHSNTGKKDLESQDFYFLFVIFVYCLASNTWEREFSDCPENEAAISFSEMFLWLFRGRKGLQENRFSLLCSFCVLLFLLWKQSLHLGNVFWVNDAQCTFLSTSTWRPRGGSPAESGMCWKIYLPASLK